MDIKRKSYTLGEFLRAAETWINFLIKSDQHAELDNLSPLHYAKPHELEGIPSLTLCDVYFSRDWTILKLWEEHRIFYEDLPSGWYLRAVSQPLRRAAAQGTGWARGRRNAGPFTQPADALD